jgi:phage RecT family recombinase
MSQSQNVEIMPSRSAFKPLREIQTIEEAVSHPVVIERFNKALPKGMRAESFLAKIRQLAMDDPMIRQVELWEILRCAITLGDLGLVPNTPEQLAWMIPRENRRKNRIDITIVLGYRGLLRMAWQSNLIASVHADVVYDTDDFSFHYGSDGHLRHRPRGPRADRVWEEAYAFVKLTNGGELFERMHREDVFKIRNESDAYKSALAAKNNGKTFIYEKSPWVAHQIPMTCKTLFRQITKILPSSTERFAHAVEIDGHADAGQLSFAGDPGDLAPPIVVDAPTEHTGYSQRAESTSGAKTTAPAAQASGTVVAGSQGRAGQAPAPTAKPGSLPKADAVASTSAPVTDAKKSEPEKTATNATASQRFPLFSIEGELLGEYETADAFSSAFLSHGNSVIPPDVEEYIGINSGILKLVTQNPKHRQAFRQAGLLFDEELDDPQAEETTAQAKDEDADAEKPTKTPIPSLPAIVAGRGGTPDADIFKREVSEGLATLTTLDELNEWKTVNNDLLRSLPSTIRSVALLAWTGRVREITT